METPVYDFVTNYCGQNVSRLHMPGHKGQSFLGCEARDITEIAGADVLHQADGILKQSQNNAAALFGSGRTLYSTEGSSLCIKAMLMALMQGNSGEGRSYLLAARNVHRSMIDACALLDLDVRFLMNPARNHLCSGTPAREQLAQELRQLDPLPVCVYVTSPDYLGEMADIRGLAEVCKEYGIPLVVDNAHGAYLRFLDPSVHPIQLGAAMCCDSAHKTLPVLTGGAYLHIASEWQEKYQDLAVQAMAVFGSTSPSYLTLQSLDLCNRYLTEHYRERLQETVEHVSEIQGILRQNGLPLIETEPLKIVIHAAAAGYHGTDVAQEMRRYGLECEYADGQYVIWMVTPENTDRDGSRIRQWGERTMLRNEKPPLKEPEFVLGEIERVCTIREAVFGPAQRIQAEDAAGRVCAAECVACPPAVPIAVSGERITKEMVSLFRYYGIRDVIVLAH